MLVAPPCSSRPVYTRAFASRRAPQHIFSRAASREFHPMLSPWGMESARRAQEFAERMLFPRPRTMISASLISMYRQQQHLCPFPHTIKQYAYECQRNCSMSSSFCSRAAVPEFGKHLRQKEPHRRRTQLKTRLVDWVMRQPQSRRCCDCGRCIVSRVTLWILCEFALTFTTKATRRSGAMLSYRVHAF